MRKAKPRTCCLLRLTHLSTSPLTSPQADAFRLPTFSSLEISQNQLLCSLDTPTPFYTCASPCRLHTFHLFPTTLILASRWLFSSISCFLHSAGSPITPIFFLLPALWSNPSGDPMLILSQKSWANHRATLNHSSAKQVCTFLASIFNKVAPLLLASSSKEMPKATSILKMRDFTTQSLQCLCKNVSPEVLKRPLSYSFCKLWLKAYYKLV